MEQHLLIVATGIFSVTVLDSLGAVASRKLNFNYGIVSVLSLFVYLIIGYWGTLTIGRLAGVSLTGLIALYDAILGWKLAVWLRPNWGQHEKMIEKEIKRRELEPGTVIIMTLFGILLGWIGSLFV